MYKPAMLCALCNWGLAGPDIDVGAHERGIARRKQKAPISRLGMARGETRE
jgi:hypothetical protein